MTLDRATADGRRLADDIGLALGVGDLRRARTLSNRLTSVAAGSGTELDHWAALTASSTLLREAGAMARADALSLRAHAVRITFDRPGADTARALQVHESMRYLGADALLLPALAAATGAATTPFLPLLAAESLVLGGRRSEAGRIWGRWRHNVHRRIASAHPADDGWLPVAALGAGLAVSLPDHESALFLLEALAPWDHRWVVVGGIVCCWGPVELHRARLAASLGRRHQASRTLDAARDRCRRAGTHRWERHLAGLAAGLDRAGAA